MTERKVDGKIASAVEAAMQTQLAMTNSWISVVKTIISIMRKF